MILSTSHLGDNYMGISDEEGYLLAIGICCLTAFFLNILFQNSKKTIKTSSFYLQIIYFLFIY